VAARKKELLLQEKLNATALRKERRLWRSGGGCGSTKGTAHVSNLSFCLVDGLTNGGK